VVDRQPLLVPEDRVVRVADPVAVSLQHPDRLAPGHATIGGPAHRDVALPGKGAPLATDVLQLRHQHDAVRTIEGRRWITGTVAAPDWDPPIEPGGATVEGREEAGQD